MTMNEARYIIRMIGAFRKNLLPFDATDRDAAELAAMRARYEDAGGWSEGSEVAIGEFILRVAENGVPGGEYLDPKGVADYGAYQDVPLIERPTGTGER